MSRRGENIYKRKDGRWEGRINLEEQKTKYIYAKSYKEVKNKMCMFLQTYQLSAGITEQKKNMERPEALILFWLEAKQNQSIKPTTYESYYLCVHKYILPFFKHQDYGFTSENITAFSQKILNSEPISQGYKRKILSIFKTILREILQEAVNKEEIIHSIKMPKCDHKEIEIFSLNEQKKIETVLLALQTHQSLGVLICFYSGIRIGELCALKWKDIDLENGFIAIKKTITRRKNFQGGPSKTVLCESAPKSSASNRKIPLPVFISDLLKNYPRDNPDRYLLSNADTPLEPRKLQKYFHVILEEAGVSNRKFHAIRHTFASRALDLGVDIKTVSDIMGHANVSVTLNVYAHSLMEQKKKAMDKFNQMYQNNIKLGLYAVTETVTA